MASSGITSLVLLVLAVIVGFIMDYPTQKKKQMQRDEDCKNGDHQFGDWIDQYEIHNGNDVWRRKCKYCKEFQETVKKTTPYTPDVLYCFQCEIEMPTKFKNGLLRCKNCGLIHTNNYQ